MITALGDNINLLTKKSVFINLILHVVVKHTFVKTERQKKVETAKEAKLICMVTSDGNL